MEDKFFKIKMLIENGSDEIKKLKLRDSYIRLQELNYLIKDYTGVVWKNENNQEKLKEIVNEQNKVMNEFYNETKDWLDYYDLRCKQIVKGLKEELKEPKYRTNVPELAGGITADWFFTKKL